MNIKKVAIAVDFEDVLTYDPMKFVQGDYATCELDFTLADNVLEGESLFVTFVLPSGTPYLVQATTTTGSPAATLVLPSGVLSEAGKVLMQIALYSATARITNFMQMQMEVVRDLSEGAIEASDQFPILTELIADCEAIEDAEALRVIAEGAAFPRSGRVGAELDRVDAEALRVIAEGDAGSGRVKAEADRVDAEDLRDAAEGLRDTAEGIRDSAEIARLAAEGDALSGRVKAEADRVDAEALRVIAEGDALSGRVKAEADRVDAEALRVIAEGDALSGRVKAEADRVDAEALRVIAEGDAASGRVKAEADRVTAEGLRDTAEGLRDTAETGRENAETARAVFEAYNPTTAYVVGNKVTSAGSAYVCIQNGTNKAPATETAYWLLIASGGTGTSVITGYEEAATAEQLAATDTINEAFGKAQKQINTNCGVAIPNLILNGSFESDDANWTTYPSATPGSIDSAVKLLGTKSMKLDAVGASSAEFQQINCTSGDKFYYGGWVRRASGSGSIFYALPKDGMIGALSVAMSDTVFNALTAETWAYFSSVATTNNAGIRIVFGRAAPQTFVANFDGILAVNLTLVFGAGNEPTKEEMDYLVGLVPDSWWDGTITLKQSIVLEALLALRSKIGTQTYTEDNYVADGQSATASIDALDMAVKDNADLISTNIKNAQQYGNRFVRALGTKLSAGIEPATIFLTGDSTGASATGKWFYDAMDWLKDQYPTHSFIYRYWDETTRCYKTNTKMQIGSNGEGYALMPNTIGGYINTPDKSRLTISGDLDLRIKVKITSGLANSPTLISKWGSSPTKSFWFYTLESGYLGLFWSENGTAIKSIFSTASSGVQNGNDIWLRVTLDIDNGAGGNDAEFYTSVDGITWTKLGATVTGAGTTSVFDSTAECSLGADSGGGATGYWGGRIYCAEIRDGIDGEIVASPDFNMAYPLASTLTDVEGNKWTSRNDATYEMGSPCVLVLNGSNAGAAISWATDETTFALLTTVEPQLAMINFSHNELTTTEYYDVYDALAVQILTKYPKAGIICVTQNPQMESELNIYEYPLQHALRNGQIAQLSAVKDYGLIDAYKAFMETGDLATYISTDGVHPTTAGYELWANITKNFLYSAIL